METLDFEITVDLCYEITSVRIKTIPGIINKRLWCKVPGSPIADKRYLTDIGSRRIKVFDFLLFFYHRIPLHLCGAKTCCLLIVEQQVLMG